MLATLAQQYVAAINGGAVPDIKKSWDYVVDETFRGGYESSSTMYEDGLVAKVPTPGTNIILFCNPAMQ